MMSAPKLASLAAMLIAVPGVALALQTMNHPAPKTRTEIAQRAKDNFARLDANKDGKLTPEELRAGRETMHMERRSAVFQRLDKDGNGQLSLGEFTAAAADRPHHSEGRGMRGHRRNGLDGKSGMMMRADTNGDGAVTLVELQAAALARFDAADTNHDGTLSAEEHRAAWGGRSRGRPAD